ncbi:hypothetical protein TNCV_2484581 [Trichonephila clavipes]|uniref:Uncharacterized protein n=1 Tax=Trichonephila clavipes TaxID=2585209 RepID=A0A8X7BB37_TRICX|nr:hypothetical protein TNCV_2484581 [Trichonephila clavipes]
MLSTDENVSKAACPLPLDRKALTSLLFISCEFLASSWKLEKTLPQLSHDMIRIKVPSLWNTPWKGVVL